MSDGEYKGLDNIRGGSVGWYKESNPLTRTPEGI